MGPHLMVGVHADRIAAHGVVPWFQTCSEVPQVRVSGDGVFERARESLRLDELVVPGLHQLALAAHEDIHHDAVGCAPPARDPVHQLARLGKQVEVLAAYQQSVCRRRHHLGQAMPHFVEIMRALGGPVGGLWCQRDAQVVVSPSTQMGVGVRHTMGVQVGTSCMEGSLDRRGAGFGSPDVDSECGGGQQTGTHARSSDAVRSSPVASCARIWAGSSIIIMSRMLSPGSKPARSCG